MSFRSAYEAREPFSVVTHDGRTVTITPDQVDKYLHGAPGKISLSSMLTQRDIKTALTNIVADTIGSDAVEKHVEAKKYIQTWLPIPELQYIKLIPIQCVARAIRYPNEHTTEVLKQASKVLGKRLANVSIRTGVDERYANWLVVECQKYLLQPYHTIKNLMTLFTNSKTFVDNIMHTVGNFTASFTNPGELDVSEPMYEIRGYPDVAVTINMVNDKTMTYTLSSAKGATQYTTENPNTIVSLLINSDAAHYANFMNDLLYGLDIVFPNVEDLVRLGNAVYRIYQSHEALKVGIIPYL